MKLELNKKESKIIFTSLWEYYHKIKLIEDKKKLNDNLYKSYEILEILLKIGDKIQEEKEKEEYNE